MPKFTEMLERRRITRTIDYDLREFFVTIPNRNASGWCGNTQDPLRCKYPRPQKPLGSLFWDENGPVLDDFLYRVTIVKSAM
ncbi:hypothetical protein NPIL_324131 [Nephila pilipes]|uniref:Uncharacterized protein n=1 Tax=Nephila pilipes TaxID=299642 RepID=A0A8X6QQL6_NEPPI|nr:hypothetical protein NPIL_324131 [Nephila pilipes]